MIKHYNMIPRY